MQFWLYFPSALPESVNLNKYHFCHWILTGIQFQIVGCSQNEIGQQLRGEKKMILRRR